MGLDNNEVSSTWLPGERNDNKIVDLFEPITDTFGAAANEAFYPDPSMSGSGDGCRWIRIERNDDPTLAPIKSRGDVLGKIVECRQRQSQFGNADLYPRYWIPASVERDSEASSACTITARTTATTTTSSATNLSAVASNANGMADPISNRFSVMQFNILAEGLSAGPESKTPFPIDRKGGEPEQDNKKDYGGFSDLPFPSVCLAFSLRRWRLLEVMLMDAQDDQFMFDLIAMQEVDRFHGFFKPMLQLFGYSGYFAPKPRSPGVPMGWYSDGCCLFWRDTTFSCVSAQTKEFRVGNQVMLLLSLRHLSSGKLVIVAVTHLKAQCNASQERIRCQQVEELQQIVKAETVVASQLENAPVAVLVLGDFNAEPPAQCKFSDSAVGRMLRVKDKVGQPYYRSAYPIDPPNASFYTTWKIRGQKTAKRIIDYIFYGGIQNAGISMPALLTCMSTLNIPTDEEMEPSKLPGLRYPSDHMMIAATFEFN